MDRAGKEARGSNPVNVQIVPEPVGIYKLKF
jgi:hypothetical protein